jgi:hypothetical protein
MYGVSWGHESHPPQQALYAIRVPHLCFRLPSSLYSHAITRSHFGSVRRPDGPCPPAREPLPHPARPPIRHATTRRASLISRDSRAVHPLFAASASYGRTGTLCRQVAGRDVALAEQPGSTWSLDGRAAGDFLGISGSLVSML